MRTNQYVKAIADWSKAIEIDPNYTAAYYNRGMAYAEKQKYKNAIADYSKLIEFDPNDAGVYNNRAIIYFREGNCHEAWKDVYQAQNLGYQIHPGFLEALREKCPEE